MAKQPLELDDVDAFMFRWDGVPPLLWVGPDNSLLLRVINGPPVPAGKLLGMSPSHCNSALRGAHWHRNINQPTGCQHGLHKRFVEITDLP